MPIAEIQGRFQQNRDAALGLATTYDVLLGGVPTIDGFEFLIDRSISTNFGSGNTTTVFNQENIYINLTNNLVQGNPAALANFNTLSSNGPTLAARITALYNAIVPASLQTDAGRAFITRPEGIAFYQSVAAERGVAGDAGAAIVALASLLTIVVRDNSTTPGIGQDATAFFNAVIGGTATLPEAGNTFTPIENADGVPGSGGGGGTPPTPAFPLTLNADTATATTFNGPLLTGGGGAQIQSLASADNLQGSGAAVLNATLNGTANPTNPTVSGVPTINLTVQTAASTYDASKTSGATRFNSVDSTQNLTVSNIASLATVGVTGSSANADSSFRFANTLVAGAADTATVVVNNVGRGAAGANGIDINVSGETAGGFETIALQSTGAASRFTSIASSVGGVNVLKTLNVSGDQAVRIDGVLTGVTTIDASTFTAGLRVLVDNVDVNVKGGSADDFFSFALTKTNADIVDGGGGFDTLSVTQTANLGVGNAITNVENLRFDPGAAGTVDMSLIPSLIAITQNSAGAITVTNFDKTTLASPAGQGVAISNVGALTIESAVASGVGSIDDVLNVAYGFTGPAAGSALQTQAGVNAGALTANGVETLRIFVRADDAGQTALGLTDLAGDKLQTITISGGAVGEAFALEGGAVNADYGSAVIARLDASAFIGDLRVGTGTAIANVGLAGVANSGQVIIGGSGNDNLRDGGRGDQTTNGDQLTGGLGNDVFTFGGTVSTAAVPNAAKALGAFTAAELNLFTAVTDANFGGATTFTDRFGLEATFDFAGVSTVVNTAPVALVGASFGEGVNNLINNGALDTLQAADNLAMRVGLFSFNNEVFLIGNEARTAATTYEAGNAVVLRVTGFTGTLDAGDILLV